MLHGKHEPVEDSKLREPTWTSFIIGGLLVRRTLTITDCKGYGGRMRRVVVMLRAVLLRSLEAAAKAVAE
jgi:hypothetical protein